MEMVLLPNHGTEGGKEQADWLHLEKEGNSILHFQWALDHVPSSPGDNIPTAKLASQTDKHQTIPRFPVAKKNVIIPCVVSHLCNLYGPIGVGYNV